MNINRQQTIKPVSYHFDRIGFNVYFDCRHLLSIPALRDLNERGVIDVFEAYPTGKKGGYNSRIEATAPTTDTFEIIERSIYDCYKSVSKFSECKSIDHFIVVSKIEIARDFICDKESDANLLADRIMSMTGKKYTARFTIYDAENDPRRHEKKNNPRLKEEIFSTRIGYWGNIKSFEYAVYARYSKVNKLPCTHTEWRIFGSHNIWKRTGLKSIADMKDFAFERFFEEMDRKFLVYEDINKKAIGRFLTCTNGRRILTKRQKISVGVYAAHFLSGKMLNVLCRKECRENDWRSCESLVCEIRSAAALKQYLKQEKGKVRNMKKEILGHEKYRFFTKTPITMSYLLQLPL